jgi:hypothetical protein
LRKTDFPLICADLQTGNNKPLDVGELMFHRAPWPPSGLQQVLKKARTRAQAIRAKTVIENKLFENRYKIEKRPEIRFDKFVKDHFLPYSKLHKRTYPDDVKICDMFFEPFGRLMLVHRLSLKALLLELLDQRRIDFGKQLRNPATVNRELCVLSKIFSLAFDAELIESNPCRRVRKFRTDSGRTRLSDFG